MSISLLAGSGEALNNMPESTVRGLEASHPPHSTPQAAIEAPAPEVIP